MKQVHKKHLQAIRLRLSHEVNGELARDYFSRQRLAPTFPADMASEPRINGS